MPMPVLTPVTTAIELSMLSIVPPAGRGDPGRLRTMTHSELGRLHINCDILTVPDDDQVVFMTADPDTRPRALRYLATRAA